MTRYDVVIVGAGPVGSTAARKCAEAGLKTLFVEEHVDIGLPQHCSGWLSGSKYTERLMERVPKGLIVRKVTGWRIWSPSGKQICEIDDFGFGGWFVDRQGFDKFLAKEAVRAGADLLVGTKFIDLIKKEEQVEGIIIKARELNLKIMIGCMTETSCAITAASHLAGLADWVDLDGAELIYNDIFTGCKIENGKLIIPESAGIGVEKIAN